MKIKVISAFFLLNILFIFTNSALAANPVVNTTISVEKTGSEPFDDSPPVTWDGSDLTTAGFDESEENNVVRLQDSITYKVEVSVNDSSAEHLTATVVLDKKQAWIEIPTGCMTDPADVTPVSSISEDGRTLFCNMGFAIEGTTKVFFPTARAIGASYDGTEITLNDDRVVANVTAEADGLSEIASDGPAETIVTAFFRVDTIKDMKVSGFLPAPNDTTPIYQPLRKKGADGVTDGVLMEFRIKAKYLQGSMIADSDEVNFLANYDLFDYYTDDNDMNNNAGLKSTNGVLYTWDSALPACALDGDHGDAATISCTNNNVVGDWTSDMLGADGVNDPNFDIALRNIDVRDPDGDGNLFEFVVNLWFPRAADINTHQDCAGGGTCVTKVINQVGVYDSDSGNILRFNPVSTEDAGDNNLTNYNEDPMVPGDGEPFPNFIEYDMGYPGTGSYNIWKSFQGRYSAAGVDTKAPEQKVAAGQIIPFFMNIFDYRLLDGAKTQVCDKIDTNNFEYVGLSGAPRNDMAYAFNHREFNPAMHTWGGAVGTKFSDASPFVTILYSTEAHANITEQRDDTCNDDVNGDGHVNIMDKDGVESNELHPVDWYEDPDMVPGGRAEITKLRQEVYYDKTAALAQDVTHKNWNISTNYLLKVKTTATGYENADGNDYIPNYMSTRRDGGDGVWDTANYLNGTDADGWTTNVASDDPMDLGFGYHIYRADRVQLVPSGHSIEKYTDPRGLKVVRGGDVVDFIIEPTVFGLWDDLTINTVRVIDNLPTYTDYINGSEMFSTDGGMTWLSHNDYVASMPAITITNAAHNLGPSGGGNELDWRFGSVENGEQLPMIKYSVLIQAEQTSGNFKNTATIISDIGVDNDGDGSSDNKSAAYQLTIVPEFGFDVLKTNQFDVYTTNAPFEFELVYKNLGGEDYGEAHFIDILPYNTDGTNLSSGIASMRDPGSMYSGIYRVTKLTDSGSGETFYATDADPASISPDPCHEDNYPLGYMPVAGDFCYDLYVANSNAFVGGSNLGTGLVTWQQCVGNDPTMCGTLTNDQITAISFIAPAVLADGGKTVKIELTPEGNVGGDPVIDADGKVSAASTGDIYTNTYSGRIGEISLPVISNDVSVTVVSGSIGDTVFFDDDASGAQNAGEAGIEGVEIALEDDMGNPIYVDPITGGVVSSTYPGAIPYVVTTDADGKYSFDNLPTGNYEIVVNQNTLPSGYMQSADPDADLDSTSSHTLVPEADEFGVIQDVEDNLDQDFGYTPIPASIGNKVWFDADGDGVQDAGEPGVAGVVVNLLDAMGNIIDTVVTDGSGAYLFEGLTPGVDYSLEFVPPAGYDLTSQDSADAANDGFDSDANPASGQTETYNLEPGEFNQTVDAGLVAPGVDTASLGDTIWLDADGDGVQDAGESGVPGVTVILYDGDGVKVGETLTDGNGNYLFEGLLPGDYYIEVVPPLVNGETYTFTGQDAGGDDALDSDVNPGTGISPTITLEAGEDYTDLDAGLESTVPLGSIGDQVWLDLDEDGQNNDGASSGVAGVVVNLYNDDGDLVATTTTDADGNYLFPNLLPDDYYLDFDLPASYDFTTQDTGAEVTDSDADQISGQTDVVTLNSGDNITNLDAGLTTEEEPGAIQGSVWEDLSFDGQDDGTEPPVEGIVVELFDVDGNLVATTTTDVDGDYEFNNLPPGDYSVQFTLPDGSALISPNSGDGTNDSDADADGFVTGISVGAGETVTDVDAGIISKPGEISGTIISDSNNNGVHESGENGITGVIVDLYIDVNGDGILDDGDILVSSTTTDSDGNYVFPDLQTDDGSGNFNYVVVVSDENDDVSLVGLIPTVGVPGADGESQNPDGNGVTLTPDKPEDSGSDFGYIQDEIDTPDNNGCNEDDIDHDGIPNEQDLDIDGDGIPNELEDAFLNEDGEADIDGDGIINSEDIDSDGDGLIDFFEAQEDISSSGFVRPSGEDLNSNGIDDAYESSQGGVDIIPFDMDGDGESDFVDLDSDNDGINDAYEVQDPNNYIPPLGQDEDCDGLDDAYDGDFGGIDIGGEFDDDNTDLPDFREGPGECSDENVLQEHLMLDGNAERLAQTVKGTISVRKRLSRKNLCESSTKRQNKKWLLKANRLYLKIWNHVWTLIPNEHYPCQTLIPKDNCAIFNTIEAKAELRLYLKKLRKIHKKVLKSCDPAAAKKKSLRSAASLYNDSKALLNSFPDEMYVCEDEV